MADEIKDGMRFGAIIIGDEILSGRRSDRHLAQLIKVLGERGLALDWAEYVGDQRERLTATLRRTLAGRDVVFSFGGIGATPDDHTRHAAAAAAGVALEVHPEGRAILSAKFGDALTDMRLRLVEFPTGATLIPNPYNQVPGFSMGHHHFLPGFPVMSWPMTEWLLDTCYAAHFHQRNWAEAAITIFDTPESTVIPLMEHIESAYPGVVTFSLPNAPKADERRQIEFGAKGAPDAVARAMTDIRAWLDAGGCEWVPRDGGI